MNPLTHTTGNTSGVKHELAAAVYTVHAPTPSLRRASALTPEEMKIVEGAATAH